MKNLGLILSILGMIIGVVCIFTSPLISLFVLGYVIVTPSIGLALVALSVVISCAILLTVKKVA